MTSMRLAFLSDTHNQESFDVPCDGIDVLVHCGDLTMAGTVDQIDAVAMWLARLPVRHKIIIAGNHDWLFQINRKEAERHLRPAGAIYLQDSSVMIDGVKFYGSPWQPWFFDWAFNFPKGKKGRDRAQKTWAKIPHDTDILLTHGPAYGLLDRNPGQEHCGDRDLLERLEVVKPTIHAYGHIHHSAGTMVRDETLFVNACICDESYSPIQPARVVDYFGRGRAVVV
jgi:Icc-related predicted phosphoesterase